MPQPITLIAHVWNESFFLPYFIRHYLPIVDRALIFDYDSVDGSVDIIRKMAPEWEVRQSQNKLFDGEPLHAEIREAEREFDGWKLVMNATEYMIHEDLRGLLHSFGDEPTALWATDMAMVDHPLHLELPITDEPLYTQRWHGHHTRDNSRGRMIHNHEHGHFGHGRHSSDLADRTTPRDDLFVAWFRWSPLRRTWHQWLATRLMLIDEIRHSPTVQRQTALDYKNIYRSMLAKSHDLWLAHPTFRTAIERMVPCKLPEHEPAPDGYLATVRFDEEYYLASNPDVAEAVAAGHWPDGQTHFEACGFVEGRAPCAS